MASSNLAAAATTLVSSTVSTNVLNLPKSIGNVHISVGKISRRQSRRERALPETDRSGSELKITRCLRKISCDREFDKIVGTTIMARQEAHRPVSDVPPCHALFSLMHRVQL